MKAVYWIVGIVLGVPAIVIIGMFAASELGGEVVTLDRTEPNGEVSQVRVWIVDESNAAWIEHGDAESFWITQLSKSPDVVLSRKGQTGNYVGAADPDSHDLYHQLRREKYGWADHVASLFSRGVDECPGLPVRLQLDG